MFPNKQQTSNPAAFKIVSSTATHCSWVTLSSTIEVTTLAISAGRRLYVYRVIQRVEKNIQNRLVKKHVHCLPSSSLAGHAGPGSIYCFGHNVAVGQHQWYHFGVGSTPIVVYFSGDWDVHWGYGLLTHGHVARWRR